MVASIVNGETGLSARNKLNELVTNNNTIENLPDGTIPMAGGTSLMTSSVREMTGMIESTKPLMSTGFQSNSVMLVGAGEAITAEVASGDLYRAIGARFTKAGGTERPGFVDTEAQVLAPIQTDDTQTISGDNIQFIFASTASGIATSYTFRSRLTTGIDGCNFISRFGSHTADTIAFDYIRDNGGTGFRIPAQSETSDPTTGEFTITLPVAQNSENGVEFREDVPTYVTISSPNNEVIMLAGGPLTQEGIPTQQVPWITATGNIGPVRGLLHDGDITAEDITNIRNLRNTPDPQPSINSFSIDSQSTTVAAGTTLSGTVTFNYVVHNSNLVQGTLTLAQDGTNLSTTVSPTGTTLSQAITEVTLAAGQSTTFTLSGTSTTGRAFSRSFTVRAAQPHELAYWGIRATNDFATTDLTNLTSEDITMENEFDMTGAFADQAFLGLLVPADMDILEIRTLGFPVRDEFTRTTSARTISSQDYILYTLQNTGGVAGSAAYTVEVRDA